MRLPQVENERIPVGGHETVRELGHASPPEVRPSLLGRVGLGGDYVLWSEQAPDVASGQQPVVEALFGVDIVVLEIEGRQLGVRPVDVVPVEVALEQTELGSPVQSV